MRIIGNNKANRIEGTHNADDIFGLGGNDKISGRNGADRIYAGSGKDTVGGGSGHDWITTGSGSDTIVFRSFRTADSDVITDFKHLSDTLAFDHASFSSLHAGDLKATAFYLGEKAHDQSDRFIYDKTSGHLYYDDDGNGAHAQHLVATLANHASLSAADLLII